MIEKLCVIRNLDDLGRISIPSELRKTYNLEMKEHIEIYLNKNNDIVLKKFKYPNDENIVEATGIVRRLDELGRIVIPKAILKNLCINKESMLQLIGGDNEIIVREQKNNCIFCDRTNNLTKYKNRYVCQNCLNKLKSEY